MTAEDVQRYQRAMHAMQSGVAAYMNVDPGETSPKHVRVGVNSAMLSNSTLAKLLIDKGIATLDEIQAALADAAEKEAADYQRRLSDHFGKDITLR